MKYVLYFCVASSILFSASGCGVGKSNQASRPNLDDGFWAFYSSEAETEMHDVWKMADGVLVCTGSPLGYLYSNDEFGDFVLRLEWRWPPHNQPGKGGVLIRMTGEHKIWPKSLEAQINAGDAGDFWGLIGYELLGPPERTQSFENEKFGKLTNVKKTQAIENPPGQWNTYEIISKADTVTLIINGTEVNKATGCTPKKGRIILTAEGTEIHFRNIELIPHNPR